LETIELVKFLVFVTMVMVMVMVISSRHVALHFGGSGVVAVDVDVVDDDGSFALIFFTASAHPSAGGF